MIVTNVGYFCDVFIVHQNAMIWWST